MNPSRHATQTLMVGPTSQADLEQLEPIIIKPVVMRGCFGAALGPRLAREILVKEWRACQANPTNAHVVVRCLRHARWEVAGAGYLLDGELRFFVTPELHRHGLGRALVMALRGEAERRQLHELSAWVFPENTASARLLESCGFTPGATMQVVTFERPVVHFGLSLDTAPAHLFGAAPEPNRPEPGRPVGI
jgi:GNAT superfamily N-acetyltransferase